MFINSKFISVFLTIVLLFSFALAVKNKSTSSTSTYTVTTGTQKPIRLITANSTDLKVVKEVSKETKMPFWLSESLVSILIIVASWLVFWLFRLYGVKLLLRLSRNTSRQFNDKLVLELRTPISLVLFSFGLWITLEWMNIPPRYNSIINLFYIGLLTVIGAFIVSRIVRISLEWYAETAASRTQSPIDTQFFPVIRKTLSIIIWVTAFILILDQFGYKITWLITSLGIGGLAVALGLQDTLSNFFSGFYIMMDKPVRFGDFVKLETGQEGFIEQVGWRSTRIRGTANNVIVIPNARLAQSIIINCHLPSSETRVPVECGVGYNSDLVKVEKISIEVAKEVQNRIAGGKKDFEPIVRFHTLGDSNINFRVILSVTDFQAQYLLKHEFLKAMIQRFKEENIEIAYPTRSLYIEKMPLQGIRKFKSEPESQPTLFDSTEKK